MLGTFGGALEARQIDASHGKLTADVTGEVEEEDGVLVIRRIHVAMRLTAAESGILTREPLTNDLPDRWRSALSVPTRATPTQNANSQTFKSSID